MGISKLNVFIYPTPPHKVGATHGQFTEEEFNRFEFHLPLSQLNRTVEYTDCISAKGVGNPTPTKKSVLDITLNNLMVRLQSWSFGECKVHFRDHYSLVHFDPK